MDDYFKYLVPSKEDKNWGFYLNVGGTATIPPGFDYPPKQHPSGYYFNFNQGRVLHEYQINYISEGEGVLINEFGKWNISPGSIMITFPNVWHRYKPSETTGWRENYIGFQGDIPNRILKNPWFSPRKPIVCVAIKEEFLQSYFRIFDLIKDERPGFQQVISGIVLKLLGFIVYLNRQKYYSGNNNIESIIQKIRFYMRENIDKNINIEEIADEFNIGYSYLRQMFKKYTNHSPGQYFLSLKIIRATELLRNTNMSLKEVSNQLGFNSVYYFSRIFKEKTGVSPSHYKKNSAIKNLGFISNISSQLLM